MDTQAESPALKITPDFSHRVKDYYSNTSTSDLLEEVDTMVLRSKSILEEIWILHMEMGINQINSQQIHCALNSVIHEFDNITLLLNRIMTR
jgi:hypothetical protein